ncbi:MAG: hypothetical protein CFH22_00958 [Alphaproteobacteria bacterium MarineAlpha5_Bin12]|nr:hypothetical protein [Pelagibacteraceae bacterium]PPR41036.1 MAG: hypothetical protein CFH22_00958 [Alphaproteobacteria bacterium MarineAlpha5_Bin12]|tara:strand:- start:114 stop:626 length:513 start_codon:yes stop_codon:yes gene_type:complete
MSVEKTINLLPKKDDNQICRMFINAIDIISNNKPQKEDAMKMLNAIQSEWKKRSELFLVGKYKATSPKLGMLGFLGYHVGHQGEPTKRRRFLIDWIMTNELPLVQSPSYTLEWKNPNSLGRYKKFHRVLQSLITSNEKRKDNEYRDFDKAIMEWKDDLDYLENKWKIIVK